MSDKEFVLNAIVTKLELGDNELFTRGAKIVNFEWGDDPDLRFDITPDRINVSTFNFADNIEFRRNALEFVANLEARPFKLTVFETNEVDNLDGLEAEDSIEENDGMDGGNKPGLLEKRGDVENGAMKKIGEAECAWPSKLIASFKTNNFSSMPFVENYDLKENENKIGSVTISILSHSKCEEATKKIFKEPYVDKDGKLGVFKEFEDSIDPNDIFFVVGNTPCPQPMGTNILATCGGEGSPCLGAYEPNRYKFMQGLLVGNCNVIDGCGAPNHCQGDMELCNEVLAEIKLNPFKPGKSNVCYKDPCERLFGHVADTCDELTSTDTDVSCHAEFHTLDCESKRKKKEERKHKSSRLSEPVEAYRKSFQPCEPTDSDQLSEEAIKNDKFDRRRQEVFYPHTGPTQPVLAPLEPVQPRICPICCADISWVSLYGACPKCGFQPSLLPPLAETSYNENRTAQDILDQFKDDLKKFRRENDVGLLGCCNCTPHNECLNCQIRKCTKSKGGTLNEDGGRNDRLGPTEKERKSQQSQGKENMVNNIIEEILKKRANDESTKPALDHKISAMTTILEWCKKKSAKKSSKEYFKSAQDTEDSLSDACPEYSSTLKANVRNMLSECNISTSTNKSYNGSKAERTYRETQKKTTVKKQPARKVKYYNKDEYPGIILGHKDCVGSHRKIPRYMGWLWSASIDERRRGWRPGAVRRETHKIMEYFSKDGGVDSRTAIKQAHGSQLEQSFKMPTILVTKKRGQFRVTVHPMRDPSKPSDPRDTRSLPIEFTIDKDPVEILKREIKSRLKKNGFRSCICGKPIYDCECRSDEERDKLEEVLEDVCDDLCIQENRNTICFSDTTNSDSEIDIKFSPPAALLKRPLPKKTPKVFVETQCDPEDIRISTAQKDVWKMNPKEFVSREGHPCGGISRPPHCRPPWSNSKTEHSKRNPEIFLKKVYNDDEKSKQVEKTDKSKATTRIQESTNTNANHDNKGSSVKFSGVANSNKPNKFANEVGKTLKPTKPEKSGKSDELSKGHVQPEKPQAKSRTMKKISAEADKRTKTPAIKSSESKPETTPATKPEQPKSLKPPAKLPEKPLIRLPSKPPAKMSTRSSLKPPSEPFAPTHSSKLTNSLPSRVPLKPIRPSTLRQPRPNKSAASSSFPSKTPKNGIEKGVPKQIRSAVTSGLAQKPSRSSKPAAPVSKRFSMGQLPVVRQISIEPCRNQPCQEASLMGVQFRPLDCNKAVALACPSSPIEQRPCNVPCFRSCCPHCLR